MTTPPPSPITAEKRWKGREEWWRSPADIFRPEEFGVDVLAETEAKAFVEDHHYSGTMPAVRLCVGLWRKMGVSPSRLVGTAVFSVPMQRSVVPCYTGLDADRGVELGRLVLLDECGFNAESWMIARAFKLLQKEKPSVITVVSYADPMERDTAEGLLCKPAHRGQIYQASNALFAGRTRPRYVYLDRWGRIVSERAIYKIKNGESGQDYAARQLVAAGADPRRPREKPTDWLARVLVEPNFRRMRHPGNFAYVFGLDSTTRGWVELANDGGQDYPAKAA